MGARLRLAARVSAESQKLHYRMQAAMRYEVRFFFCQDPQQVHGTTIFGTAVVTDISSKALRALAHQMIVEDPSGRALEMVKTEIVVADVGEDKACGGLGASNPVETVVLFRPE